MTIPEIAQALAETLAPALPYLLSAGKAAGEEAAKKLGEDAWEGTKGVWKKLRGKVEASPAAKEAAEDVAAAGEDADARAALRHQLRKILAADEALAAEITGLLEGAGGGLSSRALARDGAAVFASSGAVTAGAGGAAVGGGVQGPLVVASGGSRVEIHAPGAPPEAGEATLRQAYLHRLVRLNEHLSLAAVDPSVGEAEADARLSLAGVYTALLTLSSRQEGKEGAHRGMPSDALPEPDGRERRRSALELLDAEPQLVLLGDPGSGKSTFVQFVTLCLAGEALGRSDLGLPLLTAPLPDEEGDDAEERQPWSRGPLLPVPVVLRDFIAKGDMAVGEEGRAEHLWRFLTGELEKAGLGDYAPALRQELREQGGLLLLDGLDEVPEAEARRVQIRQVVSDFAAGHPHCRVLLTSRTYAYQKQQWRLPDFAEAVLAPFSSGQIRRFVSRWYGQIAALGRLDADDAAGRAALLERAIFGNDRLRELAERPLLLALMASLHAWRGGSLPEHRERLYADAVELLLDFWERRRLRREAGGEAVVLQPGLAEWLKVDDKGKVRTALDELAYEAHRAQPDLVGTADLPEGELVARLMRLSDRPGANPKELMSYLSQRAGLLLPRGVGVYTFPHRTLQEYLAACHLTTWEYPRRLAERVAEQPERWREVALLAAAKAARGTPASLWYLVEALCHGEPGEGAGAETALSDVWGAHLAAEAVAESADLARLSDWDRPKLERLRRWLLHVLRREPLPALERARAGTTLARLGDPRFDPELWHLPREPLLGFVPVPEGRFLMGSDAEQDGGAYRDEQPQHELTLPAFYLARYPVTVAQFRTFVEECGYEPTDRRCLDGVPNHPVVDVTWYDALAYCRWLGERLRELAGRRLEEAEAEERSFWRELAAGELAVTLPSEAEWEKAAGGREGRIYPWGDEADPERANYDVTGIGSTSAVGCFPSGASPYGCEEMAGNVWEWTRSRFDDYPYDPRRREDLEGSDLRVLRGGAFFLNQWYARCAVRNGYGPGGRDVYSGFRVVASPFTSGL